MKKLVLLVLCICVLVLLSGCGPIIKVDKISDKDFTTLINEAGYDLACDEWSKKSVAKFNVTCETTDYKFVNEVFERVKINISFIQNTPDCRYGHIQKIDATVVKVNDKCLSYKIIPKETRMALVFYDPVW